jgi:hypothetical protein
VPDDSIQAECLPIGDVGLETVRVLFVVARLAIPFHIEQVPVSPMMVALQSVLRKGLPTALTPSRLLDETPRHCFLKFSLGLMPSDEQHHFPRAGIGGR